MNYDTFLNVTVYFCDTDCYNKYYYYSRFIYFVSVELFTNLRVTETVTRDTAMRLMVRKSLYVLRYNMLLQLVRTATTASVVDDNVAVIITLRVMR